MAYDKLLVSRIRMVLSGMPGVRAMAMFGGLGFLVQGNLACGVTQDGLIVRVGPEHYETALDAPHTRVFDMTGRPMKGWVMVEAAGVATDADLARWVQAGVDFVLTLPPK